MIGGVATVLDYSLLILVVELLHWPPALGAGLGAAAGAVVAYLGNHRFTFGAAQDRQAVHRRALPRFATVAALGSLLNAGIVWIGTHLGLYYLLAKMLATGTVLLITYRLNKTWSFA